MRYIYITTNQINGKRYLGQRKTPKGKTPEKDSYLGSGTLLIAAIKKYGKHNFTKEIIHKCEKQSEADYLECIEIEMREVLENKENWYNISAGGQYNRNDNHSEIISKSMKEFYSSERGKKAVIVIQEKRKIHREKAKLKKHGGVNGLMLYNHYIDNKNKLKRISKRMNNNLSKCMRPYKIKLNHSDVARLSWGDKDKKIQSLREGQKKRKERLDVYHDDIARNSFRIAKLKASNNLLGLHIISNYNIDYKTIQAKVQGVVTREYKDNNNMITQLRNIIGVINSQDNKRVDLDELIDLRAKSMRCITH